MASAGPNAIVVSIDFGLFRQKNGLNQKNSKAIYVVLFSVNGISEEKKPKWYSQSSNINSLNVNNKSMNIIQRLSFTKKLFVDCI